MSDNNQTDHNPPSEAGADPLVNFGHERVAASRKPQLVGSVFDRVAARYDMMNDFMSLGSHRLFKRMLVQMCGIRAGDHFLDLAGGTGDITNLVAPMVGPAGQITLVDPNREMIQVGRDRLLDNGLANVSWCRAFGETLPFAEDTFDAACISFGLRNFTDKDQALRDLLRVLKPGKALVVLEFSKPQNSALANAYKLFQSVWPSAGQVLVGDSDPYRYLVESIEVHPGQKALKQMFEDAGFEQTSYHNLVGGVAAIHRGVKPLNTEHSATSNL